MICSSDIATARMDDYDKNNELDSYKEFDALFLVIAFYVTWGIVFIQEIHVIKLFLLKLVTIFHYKKSIWLVPPDYPFSIFSSDALKRIEKAIYTMIDDNNLSRNLLIRKEHGLLKITFYDSKSKNQLLNNIFNKLEDIEPFQIISNEGLPKAIYSATIHGKKLDDYKIRQGINKSNENLVNTSVWDLYDLKELAPNIYSVIFALPGKDFLETRDVNNVLKFRNSPDIVMELLEVQSVTTMDINGWTFELPYLLGLFVKLVFCVGIMMLFLFGYFYGGITS